jgi:hypothetical protein
MSIGVGSIDVGNVGEAPEKMLFVAAFSINEKLSP